MYSHLYCIFEQHQIYCMLKFNSKCIRFTFLEEEKRVSRKKNHSTFLEKEIVLPFSTIQLAEKREEERTRRKEQQKQLYDVLFHMCINLQYPMKTANYRINFIASRSQASWWINIQFSMLYYMLSNRFNGFVCGRSRTFVVVFSSLKKKTRSEWWWSRRSFAHNNLHHLTIYYSYIVYSLQWFHFLLNK